MPKKSRFSTVVKVFSGLLRRGRNVQPIEVGPPRPPQRASENSGGQPNSSAELTVQQFYEERQNRAIRDQKTVYKHINIYNSDVKYYYYVQGIKLKLEKKQGENIYTYSGVPNFKLTNPAVKNVGVGSRPPLEFTGVQTLEGYKKLCKDINQNQSYKKIIAFDAALDEVCKLTGLDIVTVDALDAGKGFYPNSTSLSDECLSKSLNDAKEGTETRAAILKVIEAWNEVPKEAKGEEAKNIDLSQLLTQESPDTELGVQQASVEPSSVNPDTRVEPSSVSPDESGNIVSATEEPLYMNVPPEASSGVNHNLPGVVQEVSPQVVDNTGTTGTLAVNLTDIATRLYNSNLRGIIVDGHRIEIQENGNQHAFNFPLDFTPDMFINAVTTRDVDINLVGNDGASYLFGTTADPVVQEAIGSLASISSSSLAIEGGRDEVDLSSSASESAAHSSELVGGLTTNPNSAPESVRSSALAGSQITNPALVDPMDLRMSPLHNSGSVSSPDLDQTAGAIISIKSRASDSVSESFSYRVHTFFEKVKEGRSEPCNIQKTFQGDEYTFLSRFITKGEESYTNTSSADEDIGDDITFEALKREPIYEYCVENYDKQFSGTQESLSFHSDEISELMDAAKAYLVTEQGIDIDLKQSFKRADNTLVPLQGNILIAYLEGLQGVLKQPGKEILLTQSGQFPIELNSENIGTILTQAKRSCEDKDDYKLADLVTECSQYKNLSRSSR